MRALPRLAPAACLLALALPPHGAGQQTDVQAETRALLDKAIKAAGGADKLAGLRNVAWKGTASFDLNGQQATLTHEATVKGWDRYRLDLTLQNNGQNTNLIASFDRGKGWVQANAGKSNDIPERAVATVRDFFYVLRVPQMLPALKEKGYELSPLGEIKVGDRPAVGIAFSHKGRPDVRLFFDKENGLPVKAEARLTDPDGRELGLEAVFSRYKDFDGLKHFTHVAFKTDDREFTVELSEVRGLDQVDDSIFARP